MRGPRGFPGGSDGKESTCSAGDLGSILGRENPPRDDHTKLSKSDRKTTNILYHLYAESEKMICELIYKTEADSQTSKTYIYQRGDTGQRGIHQELGMNIHTLLHINQIIRRNLLCNRELY